MSDVFISYSRKDKAFVQKLHDALAKLGRDTWVDWEDIPPTAKWLAEIYDGIEKADTLIFIISPDSVASKTCQEEIAHADKHNKRIVPIMYRTVPDQAVPVPLSPINWIFFRPADDFDAKFQELITAIDTDLDWVKAHTRLLVRAIEWDNKKRNDAFVLRGADLRTAEGWLGQAKDKKPKPTALQREYILASRQYATRQRRFFIIGVAAALVVVMIFAVLASLQADIANKAQATAVVEANRRATAQAESEIQRNEAQRRQLAAQAQNIANSRLDLGLLLEVEANRNTNLSDVHGSLLNTLLLEPRLRKYLPGHPKGISSIALSPDGKTLAAGTVDKTIILWDVARGEPIGQPLTGHASSVISLAFSPDGQVLVSGSNDPIFRLWDVSNSQSPVPIATLQSEPPSGKVVFSSDGRPFSSNSGGGFNESAYLWNTLPSQPLGENFVACGCGVLSLAFSPDGKRLAVGGGDNHIELWSIPDRQRIKTFPYIPRPQSGLPDSGIFSLAYSPDGRWLAAGSGAGYIRLWDLASNSDHPSRFRFFVGSSVGKVAFSPDSSTLAYSNGTNAVDLWNLASGESYDIAVTKISSRVLSLAFSPDGKTLAFGTSDNSIILWDIASRQPVGQPLYGHDSQVYSLAFSADGKLLVSGDWNHNIILWDLTVKQRLGIPLDSHGAWIPSVAFSPNGKTVASAVGISNTIANTIRLWDITPSPPLSRSLAVGHNLQSDIVYSADGRTLAASAENSILLWDLENKQPVIELNASGKNIAMSPDGRMLAASGGSTVALWDIATRRPIGQSLSAGEEQVDSIAFSPDGKMLASGIGGQNKPGKIILWNTANGQQMGQPLTGHTGLVSSLAFSPDGKTLASGSWDKFIFLWDIATGKFLDPPLKGHTDWITGIAFNPANGGQTLASGSMDGTVRLWDARNHQPLGSPLTRSTGKINSIAYSPDGNWLAASGEGGMAVLWESGLDSWKSRACSIAGRNLSLAEWQEYFPSATYQKTCPDLPLPPSLTESFLISQQELIAVGKMQQALTQFQERFKLDPNLRAELEKTARDFPVWNLAKRGADLATQGNLTDAVQVYREIQYLGTTHKDLAGPWNVICWHGGIEGHAAEVKEICEKAVSLAPDNGAIRDSRGLTRALTGDYAGAIEDFNFFIDWSKANDSYDSIAQKRQFWIAELNAGRNPFDPAILESLRNE